MFESNIFNKDLIIILNREPWSCNKAKDGIKWELSVGGVTSAEHGIGLSKAPAWKKARADLIPVMRSVKKALDPNNILNPHKIMDAPDDWVKATNLRYKVG